MTTLTLTPAAERKRQQRARAAAGQVHRVAVYLTDWELGFLQRRQLGSETEEETIRRLISD